MKTPRRIDAPITQDPENLRNLLSTFARTLNVARTEAKLALECTVAWYEHDKRAFQRILENYEILANRVKQMCELLPKETFDHLYPSKPKVARTRAARKSPAKLLGNGEAQETTTAQDAPEAKDASTRRIEKAESQRLLR